MTPWATIAQVRAWAGLDAAVQDPDVQAALDVAQQLLTGLSGRRAVESTTVVARGCPCDVLTGPWPVMADTGGAGLSGGSPYWWLPSTGGLALADGACGCDLELPDPTVVRITDVHQGGQLVDPAAYQLVGPNRLRRVSGSWTTPLAVTYLRGAGIGPAGVMAVATLAGEFVKARTGADDCQLPARVQNVTRDGVSFVMLDPQAFLTDGRTGLYAVDLWLASLQPKARQPVGITSPDLPRFDRRRTP